MPTVTLEDIVQARARIAHVVHQTSVLYSDTLSRMSGCQVYLKTENLQRTGSFKLRGAANKLFLLKDAQIQRGVIAASAGNHAQGVALAASHAGIAATVVMPQTAALAKVQATEGYGARVLLHGDSFDAALEFAKKKAEEEGLTLIHAFDDPAVIAGQGTIGLELAEQLPEIDLVLVPLGGGGLLAGMALALKTLMPSARVVGVQASAAPAAYRSFHGRRRFKQMPVPTVADGIAVASPGRYVLPLLRQLVDDVVLVDEEEITRSMVLLLERCKLLVEGAGAVGLAALLAGKAGRPGNKAVVLLSGGNMDLNVVARVIEHGLLHAGRYMMLKVVLYDRPGQLAHVLGAIAEAGANVLDVAHVRRGVELPVGQVEVHLTLETRDATHGAQVLQMLKGRGYGPQVAR